MCPSLIIFIEPQLSTFKIDFTTTSFSCSFYVYVTTCCPGVNAVVNYCFWPVSSTMPVFSTQTVKTLYSQRYGQRSMYVEIYWPYVLFRTFFCVWIPYLLCLVGFMVRALQSYGRSGHGRVWMSLVCHHVYFFLLSAYRWTDSGLRHCLGCSHSPWPWHPWL